MATIPASELLPVDSAPAPRGRIPADQLAPEAPAKNPKSLKEKLAGYARATTYLNPVSGAIQYLRDPEKTKEVYSAGLEGLRQRGTESDLPEAEALNVAGRYGPAIAATAVFPPAAAGEAAAGLVPAAVRAIPYAGRAATGLASLGARAAAGAAGGGLASLGASTAAGDPNIEGSLDTAKDFAAGEVLSAGAEAAVPPLWRGAKAAGRTALEQSTKLYSGVPKSAWNALRAATGPAREKIANYAREGMTKTGAGDDIAVAMEKAQGFGRAAQEKLGEVVKGAGKKYAAMIDYLHQDVSGQRFGVADKVYARIEPYVKSQGAALRSPVGGEAEDAAKIFNTYYQRIKSSLEEGMAPGEAADILQGLTEVQRNSKGKAISAHAAELKNALIEALPGEYRFPTVDSVDQSGWSIADTRGEYRAAKEVERGTKKFASSETPVSTFGRILAGGGKTAEALKKAMGPKGVPGLGEDIAEMGAAKAGAAFAPKVGNLPRTGLVGNAITSLTAGLGAVLGAGGAHGAAAGAGAGALLQAPLVALGVSPRLAMETYIAASRGAGALERFTVKNASKFPPVVANALRAARANKERK